jgi:amino acid adenylation domain-containing protein
MPARGSKDDPRGVTVHEWFSTVASASPSCAVRDPSGECLTYQEVDQRSSALARRLADENVPAGSLIALRLPRTALLPIAILAVFKHGCAYVPLDPDHPPARTAFILRDSRASFVIDAGPDGLTIAPSRYAAGDASFPTDLAYVIYTSGSTGQPKGVLVGHSQIVALMTASAPLFGFGPDDVWTLCSSYSFDFSVWEMWGALLFGGQLIIVPRDSVRDPVGFAALLERERVTVLNQVPTAFSYLVWALVERPRPLDALRHIILGGEAVNADTIKRWWSLGIAPVARLTNMYGITETTVHVTYGPMRSDTASPWPGHSPIGRPLPHLNVHLVNEAGDAVPTGSPGEIVISGAGVALGYLNRPALTTQRFVRLEGVPGLAYRSGDWARRDEHGVLHFMGRRDFQVQIRGHRVELGEVETVLAQHPAIAACVVTAPRNSLNEPVLTAHVILSPGTHATAADLRRHAAAALPAYMVPARYAHHLAFPSTHNGKVDREALDRSVTTPSGLNEAKESPDG